METMQNRRNPSIELLRCVSMFCIVLYHSAVHGRWGNDGSQAVLNLVFGALLMWHVDSFVAISGWFGIRFSWRKFVTLWGEIFFYTMLSAGWAYWFDRTAFSWKLLVTQGGWFAGTYLMLMFMAPLLNEAIESSVRKGRRFAFGVWLTFALGLTLDWLPLSAMSGVAPGGGGGTTILTMVFVYVTARYARLLDLKVGVKTIGGIIALYGVAVAVFGGGVMLFVSQGALDWTAIRCYTCNNAPHVWLLAVTLVIMFASRSSIPDWLARIVGFCAPSMFGVYLLHDTTSFGRRAICAIEGVCHTAPAFSVMLAAVGVFFCALLIDFMRRFLVFALYRLLHDVSVRRMSHG